MFTIKISTSSLIYALLIALLVGKTIVGAWHQPSPFKQNSAKNLPTMEEFNSRLKSTFRPVIDFDSSHANKLIYGGQ